jgi:hypothetical protein
MSPRDGSQPDLKEFAKTLILDSESVLALSMDLDKSSDV